ncbi:carboxymuconolactone decarboxylase family protein [Sphingomonas sp. AOB5]|uniref:carboxymuconolactone decarboxylase family protein n=1 Tax=Sphingomonas sp. AOB5 TaxID=3034017 RepID=UPI0023F8D0B6|nr:carboxymuconolactone decarboxylase family protein [Sphingomonas sp. AOB5]MDF7775588.1 carboxymuconolactone decarboxylase family protein [Sphingomonas sp. AOB5]
MNLVSTETGQGARAKPRVPLLRTDEMSPEQRRIHDSVIAGPRGRMIGPLLAAIHSPELAALWSRFGEHLRFNTQLPKTLNELAILVCGRRWSSQVEWYVHAQAATDAGLDPQVITAIRLCEPPVFHDEAELEVYEYTRCLQQQGQVSDRLHAAIKARWGVRGAVELTAVIGYYTLVAITLNAHRIPVPDEADEPLPHSDTLIDLPPGQLAG